MGILKKCFVDKLNVVEGKNSNVLVKNPGGGATVKEKILDIKRLIFT